MPNETARNDTLESYLLRRFAIQLVGEQPMVGSEAGVGHSSAKAI